MAKVVNKLVNVNSRVNRVYKMISDQELHTEISESKIKLDKEVGSSVTFYKGALKGKLLLLKPNKMIVFTCRMKEWDKTVQDAVCTMIFNDGGDETTNVSMNIVNVPEESAPDMAKIWNENLWKKLKAYLKGL